MARISEFVTADRVTIEVYREGSGPVLVILPSYGRDSGEDYDAFSRTMADAGFLVLRPRPRGIGGSTGLTEGVSALDQANDIAAVIKQMAGGQAIVLGHAYGHFIARILASTQPSLVSGLVLAASQSKNVAPMMAAAPFLASNPDIPEEERLAVLQGAFFAPHHDARPWLDGWHPKTLAMQRASVHGMSPSKYWAGGSGPVLELIAECDPFRPYGTWRELRDEFPGRVEAAIIADAGHALFPEQPDQAADAVIRWRKSLLKNQDV
jgi:pimeloyl-ACP methyl ester carboxylesterase